METNQTDSPLRVVVADDEHLGRKRVLDLLATLRGVDVVGIVHNGQEAVDAIQQQRPDLVFLDIRMADFSGLDVVRRVGVDAMPLTVFVTAYNQHAIEAFELAALDYLLKPFEDERFYAAVKRAREVTRLLDAGRLREKYAALLENDQQKEKYLRAIPIRQKGKRRFLPVEEVLYLVADGVYVEIHAGENILLLRKPMRTLEEELNPAHFFRIHRSTIVRLDCITALQIGSAGDYFVTLENGEQLRVARGRKEALEKRLNFS